MEIKFGENPIKKAINMFDILLCTAADGFIAVVVVVAAAAVCS